MNTLHEKITLGLGALAGSGSSVIGAIFTEGDARWFCITLAAAFMMATFLALMCKRSDESIRLVIGRCGFSVLGGIFFTRPVVHYSKLEVVYTDSIALAGAASAVCILTFFVGFALLKILEVRSPKIAEKWFKKIDP